MNIKTAVHVYLHVYNTKQLYTMNGTLGIILTLYGMVVICLSIILLFSLTHLQKNVCILTQALKNKKIPIRYYKSVCTMRWFKKLQRHFISTLLHRLQQVPKNKELQPLQYAVGCVIISPFVSPESLK